MIRNRQWILIFVSIWMIYSAVPVYAMDAPGGGGANWHYSQKGHYWYYCDDDQSPHTGWLFYEGDWYWFNSEGRMEDGGYANIDGVQYYFYGNGHMAQNQYIGLNYRNADGIAWEEQDIRVVGTESPNTEDRDMITDALYEVPRGWFAQFEKDGWQMMFYKKKEYFAAPDTDMGIYYVYHSLDTNYKKVKFCNTDALLQAFGEYVGYAAGCYKEDSEWMQQLWQEQKALNNVLNIPEYYSNDVQFYFGMLISTYLDYEGRQDMEQISPKACEILDDILHLKDANPEYYQKKKQQESAKRQEEAALTEELGGPGVVKKEGQS